jgi:hypothetical protein
MEYTYINHYQIWGDRLSIMLLMLRDRMGKRWTNQMQAYMVQKNQTLGGYSWRERVPACAPYVVTTFTEI